MADSDPVTWRLALAIQSLLQTITKANGYRTDIGLNVLVEDDQSDSKLETVLPVVIDVNKSQRTAQQGVNSRQRGIDFTIESGTVASLANAKQLAHQILADIEKAMDRQAPVSSSSTSGIRSAKLVSSEILKRPEGLPAIVVQCKGTCNYLPD